jgi:HEAT repeat protein
VETYRDEEPAPDLTQLVMARVRELPLPARVQVTGSSRPVLGLKAWATMAAAAVLLIVPFLLLRPGAPSVGVVLKGRSNVLVRSMPAGEWLFAGAGELRSGDEVLVLPEGGLRLELSGKGLLDAGPGTQFRVEESGVRLAEGVVSVSVARSPVQVSTAGIQARFREGRGSVESENRGGRTLSTVRVEQGQATVSSASESAPSRRSGTLVPAGSRVRHYGDGSKPVTQRDTAAPPAFDLEARSPIAGDPEAPALPRLKALLAEGDGPQRCAAAEALGRIGGPGPVAALRGLIFAPDRRADVMVSVLAALRRSGEPVPVERLQDFLKDQSPELQREAVMLISGSTDPRARALLEGVLAAKDRDATVRRQAGELLAAKGDKQAETLVHAREEEARSRVALVRTIEAEAGSGAAALLQRFLDDPHPGVRVAAIRALSVIEDASAAGRLRERWRGERDPAVQAELLAAHALLDGPEDRELLSRVLADGSQAKLRRAAADALGLRPGNVWAAEQLRRVLEDSRDEAFQRKAVLAYVRVMGEAAHETLRRLLVPTVPADVRGRILEELGSGTQFFPLDLALEVLATEPESRAGKAVVAAFTDRERRSAWTDEERHRIWVALSGQIDRTGSRELRKDLLAILPARADAGEAARALKWAREQPQSAGLDRILAQAGGEPRRFLLELLKSESEAQRQRAVRALAPGALPEERPAFRAFFDAERARGGLLALQAAGALARTGDRSEVPYLQQALREDDAERVRNALRVVRWAGGAEFVPDVGRLLLDRPEVDLRSEAARTLQALADANALSDLERSARDARENQVVRLQAAVAHTALRPDRRPDLLTDVLQEGPDGLPEGQELELVARVGERTWGRLVRRVRAAQDGRDAAVLRIADHAAGLKALDARTTGWQIEISKLQRAHRDRIDALYRERELRLRGLSFDLKRGAPEQKVRAARELAEVHDLSSIRDLMDALEDSDPGVRDAARQSLAQALDRSDLDFSPLAGPDRREAQLGALREWWKQNEGTTRLRVPEYVEVHRLLQSRPK